MTTPYTEEYACAQLFMQQANEVYYQACREPVSREEAFENSKWFMNHAKWPANIIHYTRRNDYNNYPIRMATHSPDQLFVPCHLCNRQFCTDAWRPYGYETVFTHVRAVYDGKYECRDQCDHTR